MTEGGGKKGKLEIALVTKGEQVLDSHASRVRSIMERVLKERRVEVYTEAEATGVVKANGSTDPSASYQGYLVCQDGRRIAYHECLWCTEGAPAEWLKKSGLKLGAAGFISVQDTFESINQPKVFAAGDIASMVDHPRPKAGVFAVRAGPPLYHNLRAALLGHSLRPFTPQSTNLSLISTGNKYAIASKSFLALEGAYLWTLKDWIDRKWMQMYQILPSMGGGEDEGSHDSSVSELASASGPAALALLAQAPMRCGGCGSKVGASILSRVLSQLKVPTREDIIVGLGDDAAIIRPPSSLVYQVQTIDFFRTLSPTLDPYIFGQIAANHALSDCHAMNGQAKTALAIAVVPYAAEEKVESLLIQMMAGACQVLEKAGCVLVGGHTSEGHDLALGFSITGEVNPQHLLRKGGLKAGDVLILTKGLGTGTVLAAEMRGEAKAVWIQDALASMLQSNEEAAQVLYDEGQAQAATDVTGFGLLGHLVEMLKASEGEKEQKSRTDKEEGANDNDKEEEEEEEEEGEVNVFSRTGTNGLRARLCLDHLPALEGAQECFAKGITSSLQPANVRLRRVIDSQASTPTATTHSRYPLLFDPQTAGGLLAGVPVEHAETVIQELHALGYKQACVVGRIEEAGERGQEVAMVVLTDK